MRLLPEADRDVLLSSLLLDRQSIDGRFHILRSDISN
jgi:hypothetical protein